MKKIPDFTDSELWVVRTTLKERYGQEIKIELAVSGLQLNPPSQELTPSRP